MREKHGFTLIEVLVGLTIIAVLMVGAYTAWQQPGVDYSAITLPATPPTETVKTTLPLINPTIPDLSDWSTYENTKYRFRVKHPPSWATDEVRGGTPEQEYPWPPFSVYLRPPNLSGSSLIRLHIDDTQADLTLTEYVNNMCDAPGACASAEKASDLTVADLPAKRVLDQPLPIQTETVVIKKGELFYLWSFDYSEGYTDKYPFELREELFTQILSTFQFTD